MNDITTFIQLLVTIAVVTAPIIVAIRFIGDASGWLTALVSGVQPTAWPRGVQEEDPTPWRWSGGARSAA